MGMKQNQGQPQFAENHLENKRIKGIMINLSIYYGNLCELVDTR